MTRRRLLIALTLSITALSASTANANSVTHLREGRYVHVRSGVILVYRDHRIDSIGIYGEDAEDAVSTDFPDAKVEHKDGLWEFAISNRDNPPWGRGHWSDANTITGRLFLELRPRGTRQIDFHADWVSK